jgi:hypothetical protein
MSYRNVLSQTEIADYGHEFLDIVDRVAGAKTREVEQQLQQTRRELAASERKSLKSELDRQVPDWRQTNEDPEFLRWLAVKHEYAGVSRHQLLQDAWNANDIGRVATIFRDYESQRQRGQRAESGPMYRGADGSYYRGNAKVPVFTRQEIADHYRRRTQGRVSDADHHAFEARLQKAMAEGRVAGGLDPNPTRHKEGLK